MQTPSVELRVDITGVPHTFLVVTSPDGTVRGYGLAPAENMQLAGPGIIQDDTEHLWDASTGPIPLSLDGYQRLMEYIQRSEENPPPYDVVFGSQCSTWAFNGLVEAGIPAFVGPNIGPDNLLRDIFETIVWNPYTQYLNIQLNNLFLQARNWITYTDPLVLDLDGDGIETIGIDGANTVLFDHDGDGVKAGTGWLKGDDGFLVFDRNGNGTIDNGGELFGVDTVKSNGQKATSGLDALSDLDSNNDGVFDENDEAFHLVKVWQDRNQDGISQADELKSLSELGIVSINLSGTTQTQNLGNGNSLSATTTFTRSDGSTGIAGDLNLSNNSFYREFTDKIQISDEIAGLPDMKGSGAVRDLREAAQLSPDLAAKLSALVEAGNIDRSEFQAKIHGMKSLGAFQKHGMCYI